jgi:AcrR family transcriptional regulator
MTGKARYRRRGEVREQILAAAEELFATRPPAEVTIRHIAERAGVQHSLVHRHFGTKERLLNEVIARTVAAYAEAIASATDPSDGFTRGMDHMAEHRAGLLAIISALAEQTQRLDTQQSFPGADLHLERLMKAGAQGAVDLRILTVAVMAFTAGWAFFEDWWIAAAGLEGESERVRSEVAGIIRRLVLREAHLNNA